MPCGGGRERRSAGTVAPPPRAERRCVPAVFGSEFRARRPILLLLVYGAFLVIIGITAAAQAVMVSSSFTSTTLGAVVNSDAATIRVFADSTLTEADLAPSGPSTDRVAALDADLALLVQRAGILRVALLRTDGTVVVANEPGMAGSVLVSDGDLTAAAAGAGRAATIALAHCPPCHPLPGCCPLPARAGRRLSCHTRRIGRS